MLGLIASLALLQATGASAPQAAPPPPPCSGEEFAAFDFWVGEWDVYPNGTDRKIADSRIEKLYGGCAVRENWMPLRGAGGGSLNNLDPESGRWHQTWIGSSPGRVEFEGGPVDGGMVLTGFWRNVNGPGQHALIRMTYTKQPDGSVRQHGEASTDQGVTWQTSFDFIYRSKREAP
ncbi:MAG: hypothetical protein R3E18_00790 [Sphingomonadaceae bacterium]|nr:hypothetical protein [Sphingomonadaceae bacterium]